MVSLQPGNLPSCSKNTVKAIWQRQRMTVVVNNGRLWLRNRDKAPRQSNFQAKSSPMNGLITPGGQLFLLSA
jgi:hypothetical protein